MDWFNWYGLGAMLGLLLPNLLYAAYGSKPVERCKWQTLLVLETVFRFACFALMVVQLDELGAGFACEADRMRWLWCAGALVLLYWAFWGLYARRGPSLGTALPLVALPCTVFVLTGVWMRIPLLTICAAAFTVLHTAVTLCNVWAKPEDAAPSDGEQDPRS